jgi:ankyrin repeat protein
MRGILLECNGDVTPNIILPDILEPSERGAMLTIVGRPFRLCSFRFIAFMVVLSSSNLVWAGEIHDAVKNDDLAKVRSLIKENPDLVFSKDEDGFTPLHLAAANGYKNVAEFLLANKSDVNAKDNSKSTPLHQAVAAGGEHVDLLELLISNKADVNAADTNGLTPLHYAALADSGKAVKLLLAHGAHPDVREKVDANTPLIIATGKGYKDVAEVLLANGADANAADKKGTPLAWAIHTGHPDIAKLLRQHGGHE